MTTYDTIRLRRTIRFFKQMPVADEDLCDMVNGARCTSSAGNKQLLRYVVVRSPEQVERVFQHTAWAALVSPRRNPVWGVTSPAAFIAVTGPVPVTALNHADAGAAMQSMQLIAAERGLGCCWLGAINRAKIGEVLGLGCDREVLYVLAVGYPGEQPMAEDCEDESKLGYYLDGGNRLHVPKLSLSQVMTWQ